jgi:serine/threonine protein kinase
MTIQDFPLKLSSVAGPTTYKNTDRIGSGGFGTVWKCERSPDGRIFAKKVLDSSSASDPEILKRFRREVRMLSELDHPNIVKVIGKRLLTLPYFYVMPLYTASLADHVPALVGDETRIRKVFTQILDAVEYAHKQGVIHRDLKPQNILYNSDDDIVVSDFGLGRQLNSASLRQTGTGYTMGTPLYMAPEQGMDAKAATNASDIYALGRILLELYQSPLTLAPPDYSRIPAPIGVVLRRCFEVDPARRFASVTDLKTAFHSIFDAAALASLADSLQQVVARLAAEQFPEPDDISHPQNLPLLPVRPIQARRSSLRRVVGIRIKPHFLLVRSRNFNQIHRDGVTKSVTKKLEDILLSYNEFSRISEVKRAS